MTDFGKFLRKLRIDRGEVLYDMAQKLKVSSAFLSAIENGNKSAPVGLVPKISESYSLDSKQTAELQYLADLTAKQVRLSLNNVGLKKRDFAMTLARQFDDISQSQIEQMLRIVKKGD